MYINISKNSVDINWAIMCHVLFILCETEGYIFFPRYISPFI